MPQVVEVRFKGNRKAFFEWPEPEPLREREPVIVETERGLDLGLVGATGRAAEAKLARCDGCVVGCAPADGEEAPEAGAAAVDEAEAEAAETAPVRTASGDRLRRVVRRASRADLVVADELRGGEEDVRRKVRERVAAHGLVMKVSDAEWQWDRRKLTLYFTAEKRVDFRNLVRELASTFRTRIELRQIGVRDEAVRLDGIGRCGRRYCSATFLTEIRPIGLSIAKDQRLSLNPGQISGPCGRLLCCLRYEHAFYAEARKRFPKEGKTVHAARGAEKVVSVDIFREMVTLRAEDGAPRTVRLADLRAEMEGTVPAAAPAAPPPRAAPRSPAPRPGAAQPSAGPAAPASPTAPEATTPPAGPDGASPQRPGGRRRRRRDRRAAKDGAPPAAAASSAAPSPPSQAPRQPPREPATPDTGAPAGTRAQRRRRRRRGPRNPPQAP